MCDKFTDEKYDIGINQEYIFLALMKTNNIILNNLKDDNKFSTVDFHLPNTNIYIELKYRQISSDLYKYTLFDQQKINIWNKSDKLSNSIIFLAFSFADKQVLFIRYDKDLFDTFERRIMKQWGSTNYFIPLNKCCKLVVL